MARFANTQEIVWHCTDLIASALPSLREAGSRVSPSRYLTLMGQDPDSEDPDDQIEVFCIRISDHAAQSCTSKVCHDLNVMRSLKPEEITEDGDFVGFDVDDWRIADVVAGAISAAQKVKS